MVKIAREEMVSILFYNIKCLQNFINYDEQNFANRDDIINILNIDISNITFFTYTLDIKYLSNTGKIKKISTEYHFSENLDEVCYDIFNFNLIKFREMMNKIKDEIKGSYPEQHIDSISIEIYFDKIHIIGNSTNNSVISVNMKRFLA